MQKLQKHSMLSVFVDMHFALDGMAPPSYHGIGWCLGLYDSPKNESKIFGRVRYKSTTSKSKYLNVAKYKQQILMRSSNHGKRKFIGMFFNFAINFFINT